MITITPEPQALEAGLYIIATPIGNLKDISIRALETLSSVDKILCEDTRVSHKLLSHFAISKPLEALHDHNELSKAEKIATDIRDGAKIALISDAGTPLISDPGFTLVRHLRQEQLMVTHIPGASSVTTALVLSAMPTDKFMFHGFLPAKSAARQDALRQIQQTQTTAIVLESPHRIIKSLEDIVLIMGGTQPISLCRELTKRFEECLYMPAQELLDKAIEQGGFRGEIILVLAPSIMDDDGNQEEDLDQQIIKALQHARIKDVAHMLSAQTGLPKKQIYQRALELQQQSEQHDD